MNCKCCHGILVDEKRLWKKFCSNQCKAEFEASGERPKPKKEEGQVG